VFVYNALILFLVISLSCMNMLSFFKLDKDIKRKGRREY
jgi:hypothetical protein